MASTVWGNTATTAVTTADTDRRVRKAKLLSYRGVDHRRMRAQHHCDPTGNAERWLRADCCIEHIQDRCPESTAARWEVHKTATCVDMLAFHNDPGRLVAASDLRGKRAHRRLEWVSRPA